MCNINKKMCKLQIEINEKLYVTVNSTSKISDGYIRYLWFNAYTKKLIGILV